MSIPTVKRRKGETIESLAFRRYSAQMSYYEALGGRDFLKWDEQDDDTRKHWINSTRRIERQKAS